MARPRKIRISANDQKEFQKLVRNSKAKIKRSREKGIDFEPEIELPSYTDYRKTNPGVSMKEFLEDIFGNRADFNAWKQKQKRFTNPRAKEYKVITNEHGQSITLKELRDLEKKNKENQKRAMEEKLKLNQLQYRASNKDTGQTVGERLGYFKNPDILGTDIPDFDFNSIKTSHGLNMARKRINNKNDPEHYDKRKALMQANYIDSLEYTYNDEADEAIRILKQMNPDEFYEMYQSVAELNFRFVQSDGEIIVGTNDIIRKIEFELERYLEGKQDLFLKGI